jgi:acetoin:2,6-dichlorophenolindophenol oxidoreductase subunit alpha
MVHSLAGAEPPPPASVPREDILAAYRWMLLARVLDEKFASLYRAGKIHGGVYLGRGQEALSAAAGMALRRTDVFAPLIRDAAGRLAFGETVIDAARTYLGSALGPMRGRDGNVHRGRPRDGYLPMLSHLGATISVVNGMLLARRYRKAPISVGLACVGDGATSTGAFHEALNQAAVERLPLVVVVADNQYAYSTPTTRQFACRSLVDRAVGYGISGHALDGTEIGQCLAGIGQAVQNARAGGGPQLVVAQLLRLCGHGEHDDAGYITAALKESNLGRDCLVVAKARICAEGWAGDDELEHWRADALARVEEAVSSVQREPAPDPYQETWCALATTRLHDGYASEVSDAARAR